MRLLEECERLHSIEEEAHVWQYSK
jgi:hypothetical protein